MSLILNFLWSSLRPKETRCNYHQIIHSKLRHTTSPIMQHVNNILVSIQIPYDLRGHVQLIILNVQLVNIVYGRRELYRNSKSDIWGGYTRKNKNKKCTWLTLIGIYKVACRERKDEITINPKLYEILEPKFLYGIAFDKSGSVYAFGYIYIF